MSNAQLSAMQDKLQAKDKHAHRYTYFSSHLLIMRVGILALLLPKPYIKITVIQTGKKC